MPRSLASLLIRTPCTSHPTGQHWTLIPRPALKTAGALPTCERVAGISCGNQCQWRTSPLEFCCRLVEPIYPVKPRRDFREGLRCPPSVLVSEARRVENRPRRYSGRPVRAENRSRMPKNRDTVESRDGLVQATLDRRQECSPVRVVDPCANTGDHEVSRTVRPHSLVLPGHLSCDQRQMSLYRSTGLLTYDRPGRGAVICGIGRGSPR